MNLIEIRRQLILGIPLTKIKLRVTYYSRVSTDHNEQLSSLKNQINYFDTMIKSTRNWKYIKGYIDKGITGTSDIKRENFMKMIEDAKKDKFDLIITKEISRFSRNTLDSIKYTRELLSYGVAVLFINDNINTALPDSELRLTIMASLAQDEIRRLSERVKFGMHESIKKGKILGHNKLYGYKKDKLTNKLIIIKEEGKIVKRIFNMYAIHYKSLNEIANILNKENIKTNRNKLWTPTTISRMIQNIKYKGYYCGKKSEVVNYITKEIKYYPKNEWITYKDFINIPPLINESLWNKANNRLTQKKSKKRQSQNKHTYTSKIICKNHSKPFYRRKQCQTDTTWLCSIYLNEGKKNCNSPNIREKELNYILMNLFKTIDLQPIKKLLIDSYKKYINKNNDKNLEKHINKKLSLKNTFPKLVSHLLSKIIVSKNNDEIMLEIFLLSKIPSCKKQSYIFKRNNKIVKYKVTLII